MNRLFVPLLIFLSAVIAGHFAAINLIPGLIMSKAMQKMEARGIGLHDFTLAPQTTPQTQSVVRPSPDLAYSICRYDFSKLDGALEIKSSNWSDYWSISFFDANTNNFKRFSYPEENPPSASILLVRGGTGQGAIENEHPVVISPSEKGLILIRRLAPTVEAYQQVKKLSKGDKCGPFQP